MAAGKHIKKLQAKIPYHKITLFTQKLATLITAGVPLVQALNIITTTIDKKKDPKLYTIIYTLKRKLESGLAFHVALANISAFDNLYQNLIYAAEQSGTLENILLRICRYREKIQTITRKIRKALYYPLTILLTAIITSIILLTQVVPTFKDIFISLNATLPPLTEAVLRFSEILQSYGLYIVFCILLMIISICYYYRQHPGFQYQCQQYALSLPYVGALLQKHQIVGICQTLSTLIEAGIPLIQALEIIVHRKNLVYQKVIRHIRNDLIQGQCFGKAIQRTKAFPALVEQLIVIAEEAGELAAMLSKIAAIYEAELDKHIDGLTSVLEPLIIVFMGTLTGGLVIAMFLPIFEMGSLF